MRNFFIGLILGVSLATGIAVTASVKGPRLTGASGRLSYKVVVEGELMCTDPWVSVREHTIECEPGPEEPGPEFVAE